MPPATLSAFPGKPYGKIRLLTYISIFQVSRVVPGEQARHTALLSLGATLSRPCRLPPLPPPSIFVPSIPPASPASSVNPERTRIPHRPWTSACSPKSARVVALARASPRPQPRRVIRLAEHPLAVPVSPGVSTTAPSPVRLFLLFLYDLFFVYSRFSSVCVPFFCPIM